MSKLWSKGYDLNALVEEFTVGEDPQLDTRLIVPDILGSLAHIAMLRKVELLEDRHFSALRSGLLRILEEAERDEIAISQSDEDGHTTIENRLVTLVGDAGKRIHLGRSRNDQILTVMRIWMRHYLFDCIEVGGRLVSDLLVLAENHADAPMPGRTHMQPAMPSSVGLWAGGFSELLLDDLRAAAELYSYFDQCPLGSGAGYGTPLPLDRELTASLLGFSRVQVNHAYAGLSRGKFESRLLDSLDQIALSLSKLAEDLVIFSLPEFGWFTLPEELCTGSSIMPQKRNPDALELMRAKSASVGARTQQVKAIIRSLPSGYNRDYQDTKGPTMRSADTVLAMMEISGLTIRRLQVNRERLLQSFDDSIFATDAALELAAGGMSFRDAYREVATRPKRFAGRNPQAAIADRTLTGGAGNLRLDLAQQGLDELTAENAERKQHVREALEELAGRPVMEN